MKPLRSENAASEVVGYLIILGLTLTGISLITLVGVPSIYKMQEMVSVRNVEQAFTILDSRASQVSLGESRMQRSDINLGGGSMIVKPNSSEKSFVLIELKSGSNVTKSIPIEMGKTVYMLGEREIAYEGGGVWSKYPAGSVMLSPPEFHFNGVTLTLPIVNISGNSSIGGKGSASLKIEKVNNDGNTTKIYPNSTLTNPIPDNVTKVNITIYSKYYDAWADYFKSINLVKVYSYPAEKKVTVTLETPPPITSKRYGISRSSSASFVLMIRVPSNRKPGRSVGRPPVAMIAFAKEMPCSPRAFRIRTSEGDVKSASPYRTSTPFPLHSCSTPDVSRSTTLPFHSWSFFTFTRMSGISIPYSSALRAVWTMFAVWMRALEGMHP